jgi:hydrophobe/amphiphile efflux-1 (HAE1) family protein
MFSRFFVARPIFASVISILIVIAGSIALLSLPISRYPDITPPVVQVTASYPGADPQVVADTVAAPIEQEVNGVENMLYMSSTSASDGSYTLKITFELGIDVDTATVLVQNRVARAMPRLPLEVQRLGINTKKASTTFVAVFSLFSADGRYDDLFLTNYGTINIKDEIARINGVGDLIFVPSKDYSMRVWLDPNRLEYNSLTTKDVVDALRQQNVQVAAGQIGQQPAVPNQQFQITVNTLGRLTDIEQFENIVVKIADGSRTTRLRDVARVELGGKSYGSLSLLNGSPSASIVVFQSPGSNALDVADKVGERLQSLKKDFPEGLDYKVVYDASDFIRVSIREVLKTLLEAFLLVSIVVFIFLQDWRATLIPAITIPVSLIGTFGVMALSGLSINMVTLFGMILAIGIVVDDSIVVVENVERNMREFGLSPRKAAIKAMGEITSAIIGITLVLMAVFVPAAFLSGISGQLFMQFSLTIAFTTLFSAINALTLSPALCALLLRPHEEKKKGVFSAFNRFFDAMTARYVRTVEWLMLRLRFSVAVFVGLVLAAGFGIMYVPTGFLPLEDDGLILVNAQLPDGASLNRTKTIIERVTQVLKDTKGVANINLFGGWSIIDGNAGNFGGGFVSLEPWDERLQTGRSKNVIMGELMAKLSHIQEAIVFLFSVPPIPGVGQGGGFEMQVQDRTGLGPVALEQAAHELAAAGRAQPWMASSFATFRAEVPTFFADVDRVKALKLKIPLQDVFDTMQSFLGSTYVNDINKFGRTWQLTVQADAPFRMSPEDIGRLNVRNLDGKMAPLGTIVKVKESLGLQRVDRYNMFPAARVFGETVPGVSSGRALDTMETLASSLLPPGMTFEWTGMAYQERKTSGQMLIVVGLAVLVVMLILSAQYESWLDPIAVILTVPLAILGAFTALMLRGLDNNLYTQVGLVLLVGLAAKNAILIVEFARHRLAEGDDVFSATVQGAKTRLRPILMTSLAFIIGLSPLVVATGAGAASRQALGTAVVGGMLGATIFGIFFTPVLYLGIQKIKTKLSVWWKERISTNGDSEED